MGVDVSITTGTGFIVPPEVLAEYRTRVDSEGNWGDEELLEILLESYSELSYFVGGSYYDSGENNRTVVSVKRLSKRFSDYNMPGGVWGQAPSNGGQAITEAEEAQLFAAAKELGVQHPMVDIYLAVLWH